MTEDKQTKLKRFVLMGGAVYYASGGFEDYLGSFDTKEEATAAMTKYLEGSDWQWAHVGDIETGEMFGKGQAEAGIGRLFR